MEIQVLGGLSLENFADEKDDAKNSANQEAIHIQKKLYDLGYTAGVQLRVGHDFTNKEDIGTLRQRVIDLRIPFIVHGAAENLGVDLGECYDENNIFSKYQKQNPEKTWEEFNLAALRNAGIIARDNPQLLDKKVIIHSGYALRDKIEEGEARTSTTLRKLGDISFNLETVPEIAGEGLFFGLGGNVASMKSLLGSREGLDVLIDFTHVLISANQKQPSNPEYFLRLLSDFLNLYPSNFTHFSGLTDKLQDEHRGFLEDNPAAGDLPRRCIIKDALTELSRRYSRTGREVYVALEMRFANKKSNDEPNPVKKQTIALDFSRKQIDVFRKQYCR